MSSVLLIALLGLAFLAMLKVADSFRDLTFELHTTRAAIEQQTTRLEEFHLQWWTWAQRELSVRAEENRRRNRPTLDELMEDVDQDDLSSALPT